MENKTKTKIMRELLSPEPPTRIYFSDKMGSIGIESLTDDELKSIAKTWEENLLYSAKKKRESI